MAKINFDIKYRPQIESGQYKVETRDGRPARIICWDGKSKNGDSIVALVNNGTYELGYSFKNTGRFLNSGTDKVDLFIITPDEELTEFEKVVAGWLETAKDEPITNEMIVDAADNLMFCARQQIIRGAELSEEDERIRKNCVHFLELQKGHHADTSEIDECIAWLERQKEKNTLSTEETELNSIAFLEQLGYTCVPPVAEQKPAEWSEDKVQIEAIEEMLNSYASCYSGNVDRAMNAIHFLKSLSERFNLQPKEEWSEEDKDTIEEIIDDLCTLKDWIMKYDANWLYNPSLTNISKRIAFLKSLGPHWKPSEEQMDALFCASAVVYSVKEQKALESLYNDLKKL